ncbi:MAG: hypothetical protein J5781_03480 [Clostridia bacterium]|nr:hypothetical protein [Clostridia bacterium]
MKNSSAVKKIIFPVIAFVVLAGLMAWFGTFALHGATTTTPSWARDEIEYDSYSLDLSDWTTETYRNAPDFTRDEPLTLAGRTYVATGYTLSTTDVAQYSIEAYLISPEIVVPGNAYLFRFSYFTRMRASTPHEVTLYASVDGKEYEKVGSVLCRATGDEFKAADIALSRSFSYLKLGVRTFYSYDYDGDTTDRGLYFLSSGFALVAEKADVFERSYFDVTYDSLTFVYNGEKQQPLPTVSSTVYGDNDFVFTTACFAADDTTREVEPIHAGNYLLKIFVRNRSNFVCFVEEQTFVITKSPLFVNKIEYVCNDSYVVVLHAEIVDRTGRVIDKDELQLNYFTSTVSGHRVESASPVMNKPAENFSVGIIVTSGDFIAPTDNTFVAVENTLGSDPVYYLDKYYVVTYCGRAFDFTENIFFSVYGAPVTPQTPASVVYYMLKDDEETEVQTIKAAGNYRCVLTYKGASHEFFVTVEPRPVVAFLYTGKDIVKYYDGTTDLFDLENDTVITQLNPSDVVPFDDPDFAGDDGLIQTTEISDVVTLQYARASFARSVGNTYISLIEPTLIGSDASNYYIHPSFHILSAVLLDSNTYEKTAGSFVKTTDTYYHEGKTYAKASFARADVSVGGTVDDNFYEKSGDDYRLTNDTVFASGKEYYSVTETAVNNNTISILATNVILRSDVDAEGCVITCPDKVYAPNDYLAPNVDSDVALPCYGNGVPVTYADVDFYFDDCNVGTHKLTPVLSNETLFDRYLPEILTTVPLYGAIVPRVLSVDITSADLFIENTDKEYDGTAAAAPRFTDLILTETPVGFPAFSDYAVSYGSASYSQTDVGVDLTLTVNGLTLTGLTDSAASFLSNYTLSAFSVTGDITPKTLIVYSESLRVFEGENPRVSTNAEDDSDLQKRIYSDEITAAAGGAAIPATRTTQGDYYLRIDSLSDNYIIPAPGYVLVPMSVIVSEKTRQKLLVTGIGLPVGSSYTLLVGSVFAPNVVSVEESTGLSTGLAVNCLLSDPSGCMDVTDGVWTAINPGSVTLTLSQAGNNYYYEADTVTLSFDIITKEVTGAATASDLYGGHALPSLSGNYHLNYNGAEPSGNLIPSDQTLVASGTAQPYTYYFISDPILSATVVDFSLAGKTYYVKDGFTYAPAPGEYSPYSDYYAPVYVAEGVTPGAVVSGLYYENVFKQTTDTVFVSGKDYYVASYAADNTVPANGAVPVGIYYEKTEGRYSLTNDATFVSGKRYYLSSAYSAAEVTANAPIEGLYFELSGNVYVPTSDEIFDEEKTYYLPSSYAVASVDYGYAIPEEIFYYERSEDVYTLTEDKTFSSAKTYYRIVYTTDVDVIPDTSVSGVYYELDQESYRLTYDNVFAADKNYFIMTYVPVHFISAGDAIDATLYLEKGDNDALLEITDGSIFEDTRDYVLAVWTETLVREGTAVSGEWYEKVPDSYRLTDDMIFLAGKNYYVKQYVDKNVTAGQAVAAEVYEKKNGAYVLTEDTVYASGKAYYSPVYTDAVVVAGRSLNGRAYYEKEPDAYSLTSDTTFSAGKIYYTKSYVDVIFLENGNLPTGEYYYAVPTYSQTSDAYLRKDHTYYTVSYESIVVATGTHIETVCYEKSGDIYSVTSDRYYADGKAYYVASFIATDTLALREIDRYSQYYFKAQGTYEAGVTYYVYDNGNMVISAVTPGTATDGEHYYAVNDTEFEHGKTYYYLSYPFLGKAPVTLRLTANKPTVTVYTKSTSSSAYGEEPDLYDLVEKLVLFDGEEHILSLNDWRQTLSNELTFELFFAEDGEISPLTVADLDPDEYTFENNQRESYSAPTAFLKMTASENSNYSYVLAAGTATHTVTKNKIVVRVPELRKFYGESVISDEDIFDILTFEGCTEELIETLKHNLDVSAQAYSYSATGEYPVLLKQKSIYAVGTAIPANTFYENTDGFYDFTADTAFVAGKTYYVLTYATAEVTVGEAIDKTRYFILNNNTYIHPEEDVFLENTVYYELVYRETDIYQGQTLAALSDYYDIVLMHGYILVNPIYVSISAESAGHDYGNNVAAITPYVTILSSASLTAEELAILQSEVLSGITTDCAVTPSSDSGSYPIVITYHGIDENVRITLRADCFYTVRAALLNANADAPSFIFNDNSVLFDGKLHTIVVSYNTTLWEDVTIVYDKGSFSEVGNYLYTATVSKKNYEDLVLTATMSICSLTVSSSNKVNNAATVLITDPTCYNGVNGDFSVVLRPIAEEAEVNAVKDKLAAAELVDYTLLGVYSLTAYLDSEKTSLGYSSYTVTVAPSDLQHQSGMALYGYSHGQFQKLDFTYDNGNYTFSVSSNVEEGDATDPLSCFVFVKENKTEDQGVQFKWIYVAIIGAAIFIVFGIVISAVGGAGKTRRKSAHRHNRWV